MLIKKTWIPDFSGNSHKEKKVRINKIIFILLFFFRQPLANNVDVPKKYMSMAIGLLQSKKQDMLSRKAIIVIKPIFEGLKRRRMLNAMQMEFKQNVIMS